MRKRWFLIILALIVVGIFTYFIIQQVTKDNPTEISGVEMLVKYEKQYDDFSSADAREIKRFYVDGAKVTAYTQDGKAKYVAIIDDYIRSKMVDIAYQNVNAGKDVVPIERADPNSGIDFSIIITVGSIILMVILMFVIFRRMDGGGSKVMGFGKLKTKSNDNVKVRFSDVAGADEEKEELKEIVDFLRAPRKFTELGAKIPRGVLLVGAPGTGKTLFAKAIAGEANVPFFSISGSDFVEMFVGVGASRVRDLFETAKRNMPCIVFIDEIDAVGRQRGAGLGGGNDEREQTLNQLLVQMDGFETNDGIIIIAATNRADILDPALLRPGRFDRQIYVNIPDVRGREAIFKVHARNKPVSPDINFKMLARMTSGFTGADIANLLNEAAILAARDNRKMINMKDVYEGINKVLMGPAKKSRLVTESDKRITSYHEAGHAILARRLEHCDPVHEVSIIPRGKAAGYTMMRPDNDNQHQSKNKMLDFITMALGGRVAEEIVIKDVSAGAANDIKNVTNVAKAMVTQFGMSELGPIFYGEGDQIFLGRDFTAHNTYSEVMAAKIDEQITVIVEGCLKRAREILSQNQKILDTMSRVLIEKETIYTEELDMIMDGKSYKEVIKYIDNKFEKEQEEIARQAEAERIAKLATLASIQETDNIFGGQSKNPDNTNPNIPPRPVKTGRPLNTKPDEKENKDE